MRVTLFAYEMWQEEKLRNHADMIQLLISLLVKKYDLCHADMILITLQIIYSDFHSKSFLSNINSHSFSCKKYYS